MLKSRMWETHKSGSVRGIEVFFKWLEYCDTPQTERAEKLGIQNKPKCRRPYYVYSTGLQKYELNVF